VRKIARTAGLVLVGFVLGVSLLIADEVHERWHRTPTPPTASSVETALAAEFAARLRNHSPWYCKAAGRWEWKCAHNSSPPGEGVGGGAVVAVACDTERLCEWSAESSVFYGGQHGLFRLDADT
jgi:hypothetical protein